MALQYIGGPRTAKSGGGVWGILLEFEVGAIDCGARLDPLSQYPGRAARCVGISVSNQGSDVRIKDLNSVAFRQSIFTI